MRRGGVEDQVGPGERGGGLLTGVERDEEVCQDFTRDVGREIGRPLRERAVGVHTGRHLPGDGKLAQVERLVRQGPLRPPESVRLM